MLSVEEKLLIEDRVVQFAFAIIESSTAGDISITRKNLSIFSEFLCGCFEAAKREGRMNAVSGSYSNN